MRTALLSPRSTYAPQTTDSEDAMADSSGQRDHSMLTFEASGILGTAAIVEKLQVTMTAA